MIKTATNIKSYLPTWQVNKNLVWGIAIIGGVAFALYYFGRKSASVQQYPIPGNPQSSPLTDEENKQITTWVEALYTNIGSSWNWLNNWDVAQLNRFLAVSDRILIGVYNLYNTRYLSAPNTLKTELRNEMRLALTWTDDYQVMKQIVDRMDQIGLV